MTKTSVTLSLFFSLCLLTLTANAFNITKILDENPDYSTFNSYLTETGLAEEINGRQTITVLAVENSNLSPLSGKPLAVRKAIMSVHVILDYYDVAKLTKLSNNSAIVTTLFQTSGGARNHTGFLNVTKLSSGVAFGSAAPGSQLVSNLVKEVAAQPYNISVIQVSNVIVPEGIDTTASPPTPPTPPKASPPSPAPRPGHAPTPKASRAPSPSRKVGPPPEADPPATTSDAPTADAPEADTGHSKSAGAALHVGPAVVFAMALSTLYLLTEMAIIPMKNGH